TNPALQQDRNLHFHAVDNEQLLCYSKATDDGSNVILCVINVDPFRTQSGYVHLDLDDLNVPRAAPFQVHDLVGDGRYVWTGSSNYVELDPQVISGHVFQVRTQTKVERDFTTYG
ncbi:MAG: alpha-1,4-glucan--maltose-1-phosphate maltosyltransferase, partial [Actinobacteria bacterium]|nr:alpha-1,4-glucan--maltose-1-phosphate maltosyltransferase [Actinomycetota bacterium]